MESNTRMESATRSPGSSRLTLSRTPAPARLGSSPRRAGGRRAAVPSRISSGSTTTTPSNSRPFTCSGPNSGTRRRAAGGRGRRRPARPRASAAVIASCVLERGDDAGQPVAVLDPSPPRPRPSSRARRASCACHAGGVTLAAHAAAGAGVDAGERQQPVGDGQDRLRHAVADRELGDLGRDAVAPRAARWSNTSAQRSWPAGVVDWATSPTSVIDAAGLRRPITRSATAEWSCASSTTTWPYDERRAVEQRVGLVDEELVGRRPCPPLAARPGQQAVDEPDRLLRRPRRVERLAQRPGLRPHVVAGRRRAQLLLGDRRAAASRRWLIGTTPSIGAVEPLGDLVPREHEPRARRSARRRRRPAA